MAPLYIMSKRKQAKKLDEPSTADESDDVSSTSAVKPQPSVTVTATGDDSEVKVNNASLTELKIAVDDTIKAYLGDASAVSPDLHYSPSHIHEDVKLGLGWASVVVSVATMLYGLRVSFDRASLWTVIGVATYSVLSGLATIYSMYFEKDTIFVGSRKTVGKRIETQSIHLSSSASAPSPTYQPIYTLKVSFKHTCNNGKTLIRQWSGKKEAGLNGWFDVNGRMHKAKVETWISEVAWEAVQDKAVKAS